MEGSQGRNVEVGTGREVVRQLKEIKEVYIRKEDNKVLAIKDSIIEYINDPNDWTLKILPRNSYS